MKLSEELEWEDLTLEERLYEVEAAATEAYREVHKQAIAEWIAQLEAENEQVMEALAEHSLYYLDDDGNELFDQPLNWEARLLQALGSGE